MFCVVQRANTNACIIRICDIYDISPSGNELHSDDISIVSLFLNRFNYFSVIIDKKYIRKTNNYC